MMTGKNKLTPKESYGRSSIRNVTIVFGSIFSNIQIRNYNKDGSISDETSLVPLVYSAKQQYGYWIEQNMRLPTGNIEINTKLPRLSFEMTGLQFALDRGLNTNVPLYRKTISSNGKTLKARTPIAYVFDFTLSVWCKGMEDSIQILDQILPMFSPEISIKLKESEKMNIYNDIQIVLNSIQKNDNWQDGFNENRLIEWDLSFQVYADILPDTEESTIISTVILNDIEENVDLYLNGQPPLYMQGVEIKEETEKEAKPIIRKRKLNSIHVKKG